MKNTPHNLVMSALYGGRRGERPPAGNPTSIICHALMDAAGVGFPEAHQDAEAMATLALTGYELVGFDTVMPEFSVQQEAEALGCKVDWGHRDMMPDVKESPYKDFHNLEIPHDLLEKPSMRVVLDALSILKRQMGDQVAVVGKVMGPWTIGYHLAGVQNFLMQVGRGIRDAEAKEAVERVGDRISLVGNIDNANALFTGTPEDVYKQARYAIESGVNIIGPECAIPLKTPIENLKAISEAVREGY